VVFLPLSGLCSSPSNPSSQPKLQSPESVLEAHLPAEQLQWVRRLLYGTAEHVTLEVPDEARALAEAHDFEVKAYKIPCPLEQRRDARIVRVGVIQNSIAVRRWCSPRERKYNRWLIRSFVQLRV